MKLEERNTVNKNSCLLCSGVNCVIADSIPCSEDGVEGICELLAAESPKMGSLVVSYKIFLLYYIARIKQ